MLAEKLITYFKSGEKEHEKFSMDVNFGHILVYKNNLKAVSFKGPQGIESLLTELTQIGWQGIKEDEHLIRLVKNGTTIYLGAGSQVNLSVQSSTSIKSIDDTYLNFLKDTFPILEARNQLLLAIGYQPATKIEEIEFNPQKGYRLMAQYFKNHGKYAYHLMKGTANTQFTIDYAHQDDFRKKIRVAYVLAPVMAALFDNAPIFEGKVYEDKCLSQLIWKNCDAARCLMPNVMEKDFGYSDYADYLLNNPPIFIKNGNEYVYTDEKTLAEIYQNKEITLAEIEHATNMVSSNLKLKRSLEIRLADALPYPLNLAYITFWKALVYSQENLDALYEFTMTLTGEDIAKANSNILKEGVNTLLGQGTIEDLAKDLFFMAGNHCVQNEVHYLQPLEAIIFKDITPKEVILRHLQEVEK